MTGKSLVCRSGITLWSGGRYVFVPVHTVPQSQYFARNWATIGPRCGVCQSAAANSKSEWPMKSDIGCSQGSSCSRCRVGHAAWHHQQDLRGKFTMKEIMPVLFSPFEGPDEAAFRESLSKTQGYVFIHSFLPGRARWR
jgi:hypothetical protein